MDILLGIFKSPTFKQMSKDNPWHVFPFLDITTESFMNNNTLIDIAEGAIKVADNVHFVLDGINLPIDVIHSVSCQELSLIINNKDYLSKTTFYYGGLIVNKTKVLELIQQSVTDEGVPLKFSSLIIYEYSQVLQ